MRNGRRSRRAGRRPDVMESLARARPARLDASLAQRAAWPDARHFIEAAELAGHSDDGAASADGAEGRAASTQTRPWDGPGRRKLLAAVSSAIATCAVTAIVLAVAPGTVPGGSTPGPRSSHPTVGAASTRIAFHHLGLHGPWQGSLEYGVSDGVVYLTGSAGNSSGSRISMSTLPPGVRPTRQLDLTINLGGIGLGVVQVTPDGQISAFADGNVHDFTFVSLDGVSFPLGA